MGIQPEVIRLIDRVRDDRTHGASELARQAISIFGFLAENSPADSPGQLWLEIRETASILKSARPSMAPITNAVNRLLKLLSDASYPGTDRLRLDLKTRAQELVLASRQATTLIAAYTAGLVKDNDTVLTHSYSSTVTAALIAAHAKHPVKVIVTRSGAGLTGIKTARELNAAGLPVTFIDDTAAGNFISRAGKVMVGADRVCNDGGLVNGAGTYLLALAAERAAVPFWVLCETLKFDTLTASSQAELEEKGPEEVVGPGIFSSDVSVKNPYFDVTPFSLITGFVTETGFISRQELPAVLKRLS